MLLLRVRTTTEAGKYVFGSAQLNDSGKTNRSATHFGGLLLYQDPRTNNIIYTITIPCRTATLPIKLFRLVFCLFRFNRNIETLCFGIEAKQPKLMFCFG